MSVPLSHIYDVVRNIRLYHEYRILMSADVKPLSLSNSIELGTVMSAHDLSIWIILIPGLPDMFPSAPVCLCLKTDIIPDRLGKTQKILIRKCGDLSHIERTSFRGACRSLVIGHIVCDHVQ